MPSIAFATSVVKKLAQAGHIAYFAGGWVRDFLMQHPSDDIDIATSATVEEIQSLFPKTIPVGVAFGIVIVVEEGHHFEVATFRKESGYLDGRRPTQIEAASPEEDAKRRDFTINGMFWDPLKGELYDFVEGQKDIQNQIIRAIGDPHERFLEDRLRMMRAARYATRFNFPIEIRTRQAIIDHAPSLLPAVAIERVWQEFKKMAQFSHFAAGLIMLHELNILQIIFPKLKGLPVEEVKARLKPLTFYPKDAPAIAQLLELFPDDNLEELVELSDYLKLSKLERDSVKFLHKAKQMLQMPIEWQSKLEKIEWAAFYAHPLSTLGIEIHAAHLAEDERKNYLQEHAQRRDSLAAAIERIHLQNPVVRAELLIKEGILPGKKMGLLLKEAERLSVNEGIEDANKIIHLLRNSSLWNT